MHCRCTQPQLQNNSCLEVDIYVFVACIGILGFVHKVKELPLSDQNSIILIAGVPQVLNIPSSLQLTELGLELILTCAFSGAPPPNVTWLF